MVEVVVNLVSEAAQRGAVEWGAVVKVVHLEAEGRVVKWGAVVEVVVLLGGLVGRRQGGKEARPSANHCQIRLRHVRGARRYKLGVRRP